MKGLIIITGIQREFNLCPLDDWNKLTKAEQKAFFFEKLMLSGLIEFFAINQEGDLITIIELYGTTRSTKKSN